MLALVVAAVPADSADIFEAILDQVEEYSGRPPRDARDARGGHHHTHGFIYWLRGLHAGHHDLPDVLPHDWLLAWRNGYSRSKATAQRLFPYMGDGWATPPVAFHRCEDCRMGLPNCSPDGGTPDFFTTCPACGSDRIGHACLHDPGTFEAPMKKQRIK